MIPDLLIRRRTAFVLWRPQARGAAADAGDRHVSARQPAVPGESTGHPARARAGHDRCCGRERRGLRPRRRHGLSLLVRGHRQQPVPRRPPASSAPTRWPRTVDWRLPAERLPAPYSDDDQAPASVVKFAGGELVPCDPGGGAWCVAATPIAAEPGGRNNRIVIYELPTSWTRINVEGEPQVGVGSFRDVLALVDHARSGANFAGSPALERGRSHLRELGINALELLPPADSFVEREWGYATSNYFAPDYDLGFPEGHASPTPNTDLVALVNACHAARHPLLHRRGDGLRHARAASRTSTSTSSTSTRAVARATPTTSSRAARARATASAASCGGMPAASTATTR